jgi:heat-inducible transcriptional repressor
MADINQETLSEREIEILEEIVRNYILTASPTGSRFIAKRKHFDLSAATIRNIMGDLEEKGYITHPHTSAGRIPTDKGYRYYVDGLMSLGEIPGNVQNDIRNSLIAIPPSDLRMLMDATSRALSRATNQLGVILAPRLNNGIFRHVHMYEISLNRYMVHLTIDSGFVKTMVIELHSEISPARLENACRIMNERCGAMTLDQICAGGDSVFSDIEDDNLGVIRLFVPSFRRMMSCQDSSEIYTQGEMNMLLKPEFFDRDQVGAVIEILEEKQMLMHLFEKIDAEQGRVTVSIGGEIENGQFSSFSIVKTKYSIGHLEGTMGIIGPKRMPYPLLVSAVDYTARTLSELYQVADTMHSY